MSDSSSSSSASGSDSEDSKKRSKKPVVSKEAAARDAARAEIESRSRMWNTVGSDDDDDDDDSAAKKKQKKEVKKNKKEEKEKKKKKKKKEKKSKKSKKGKKEDKKEKKKKEKKSKKSKKGKKEDKKEKKKKEKKSKKSKKGKKEDKEEKPKSTQMGACDQDRWGMYGVIREADYFRKSREFEVWVAEVKKLPSFTGSKRELMELFLEYAEDYNTATMAHEKYYDLEKWEIAEYERSKTDQGKKKRKGEVQTTFNDEADVYQARKRQRDTADARAEAEELKKVASQLSGKTEKIEYLRQQDQLRTERTQAYKRGDLAKVAKLDKKLNPNNSEDALWEADCR